ncbi:histidinol dehydrogenase [Aureimonas endophytica]|uniref:Histidinol dehydrogenase n=1 Tax=Aureimonas endophytica TaxID=2027858 RepID=A0A916ZGT9_9HYPH|nr:histidinol dehydrogenase [Aureimonas endophytica]GGD96858.1 histidinol dehydrogenase [Aureimonas endophytica]
MPVRLDAAAADFEPRFRALLAAKREVSPDVDATVRDILAEVRRRGDAAVIDYTKRFDALELTPETLRMPPEAIAEAHAATPPATREALEFAHRRILAHHERQRPKDDTYADALGAVLGSRWTAIESVGLYVPGGAASYPSSVLMNAVPAKVAGVERIAMVVPARAGELNPLVLAAAHIAGIDEIYRIGGAQAVAALAYGTERIAPVAKIVGPGNAYVAAAKRQVFGTVGIDLIAGPSEVLVIADGANDPTWIAADLLAQAEHDAAAQSILLTDDAAFADRVEAAVEAQLLALARGETARASWRDFGAIILVPSLDHAPPIADRIAAEHLEIATEDPDALFARIRNAGAAFLGRHTPEVIGDYVGGSNHVLPTARSARFSSGLSVLDFVKRTSVLKLGAEQLRALGPAAIEIARVEGLDAHARSVAIRLNL